MTNLEISGKRRDYFMPTVDFNTDTGVLEISGESYLEDSAAFYRIIKEWLIEFLDSNDKKVIFNMKLTYFNTSSSKSVLEMLQILQRYRESGSNIDINWFHEKNDYETLEIIEDFEIDLGVTITKVEKE